MFFGSIFFELLFKNYVKVQNKYLFVTILVIKLVSFNYCDIFLFSIFFLSKICYYFCRLGVAGGAASGKTTVCDMIIQQLHDQRVVLVNQVTFS